MQSRRRVLAAVNGGVITTHEKALHLHKAIDALRGFNLVDIMLALFEQRGGTTPLYNAVECATEELD